jgi:hypothetical protein
MAKVSFAYIWHPLRFAATGHVIRSKRVHKWVGRGRGHFCDTVPCEKPLVVSGHKFKAGQTVHYMSGPYASSWRGGVFKIMQLLPPQGATTNNRIKSADEPYDRVVKENELDRAS